MVHDAEIQRFDLIVTREVCRFARNTVDTLVYTRKLKSIGVEVYFVNDNIWTCDGDGELRLTIMATMAQEESRKTSERVNAGLKVSQEKGVMRGAKILGYVKANGTYSIDEDEAETVLMIFNWYSEGYGYKAISRMLEEKGRLTAFRKTRWHASNVAKIIANPFYIGYQVQNQTKSDGYLTQKKVKQKEEDFVYVKGEHPRILCDELFERCQKLREERKEILDDNSVVGKQIHQTVWVKKLVCECGSQFRRVKWSYSQKRKEYSYGYQCYKRLNYGGRSRRKELHMNTDDTCDSKGFAEWKVQLATYSAIRAIYDVPADNLISKVIGIVNRYYIEEPQEAKAEINIQELEEKIQKLENRMNNYAEMRADGEISKEEFLEYRSQCEEQIKKLKSQIPDKNKKELLPINKKEQTLKQIESFLKKVLDFKVGQKTKFDDDFVEIVIYKIVAKRNDVFDIYFNTKEPEHYRWQTTGNIYRPGTFPIGGSTNRGSGEGRQVLRNSVKLKAIADMRCRR